ncbi:hypothetical protein TNCT_230521 [Trichonephila clavata]|uniref:Uncharacterized protein n=1 Tax=Trichonephila clavata TaxID=2740835 RepID=A0A8X6LIX5_TRICU|nr:hypothetical protein TNCT_230521 [Trichonephila clavata]
MEEKKKKTRQVFPKIFRTEFRRPDVRHGGEFRRPSATPPPRRKFPKRTLFGFERKLNFSNFNEENDPIRGDNFFVIGPTNINFTDSERAVRGEKEIYVTFSRIYKTFSFIQV